MEHVFFEIMKNGGYIGLVVVGGLIVLRQLLAHDRSQDTQTSQMIERVVAQFKEMQERTCDDTRKMVCNHMEHTREALQLNMEATREMKELLVEVKTLLRTRNGK